MHPLEMIKEKAKSDPRKIALPEGADDRMLRAAEQITREGIAEIWLLGDPADMKKRAEALGVSLKGVHLEDPAKADCFEEYVSSYYELRKHKGVTMEKAREVMLEPLSFGAMMVRRDRVDGSVAGALNTTGNVVRAAVTIIGAAPGIKTVSSCFLMSLPDEKKNFGADGVMFFADCAIVPDPDARGLADIAVSTSDTAKRLLGIEPKVAMLSFSTAGSASHGKVEKVRDAVEFVRKSTPDLAVDGDIQFDAAIIPAIGERKCPDSPIAGKANVFVFPDLDSGNIAYKITERLGGAQAIGPIMQGVAKPACDLSRGCSVQDIVDVTAITAVRAQGL